MVRTFDPKKILISLGPHTVTGYSDGTFVNIEPGGDGVTKKVGCDGEVCRSLDPDNTATVTLTVLLTSPTVAWCQQRYKKDKEDGEGMFPILVKDLKGGLVFSAEQAWLENWPAREFAKEAPEREIKIATGDFTLTGEESNY